MTIFPRRRIAPALALLGVLGLSGCAELGVLTAATTAPDLYALSPKSTFASTLPEVDSQIVIEVPTADASINTDRIAVKPNPLQVKYFGGARWVDRAPLVVQRLLVESFENTGKVGAVSQTAVGLRADYTIVTDLREFQAEVSSGPIMAGTTPSATGDEPITARVRLNLKLIVEPQGLILGSRAFSATAQTTDAEMLAVAHAFDQALGEALRGAVEWSVEEIARVEDERRRRNAW